MGCKPGTDIPGRCTIPVNRSDAVLRASSVRVIAGVETTLSATRQSPKTKPALTCGA